MIYYYNDIIRNMKNEIMKNEIMKNEICNVLF